LKKQIYFEALGSQPTTGTVLNSIQVIIYSIY